MLNLCHRHCFYGNRPTAGKGSGPLQDRRKHTSPASAGGGRSPGGTSSSSPVAEPLATGTFLSLMCCSRLLGLLPFSKKDNAQKRWKRVKLPVPNFYFIRTYSIRNVSMILLFIYLFLALPKDILSIAFFFLREKNRQWGGEERGGKTLM